MVPSSHYIALQGEVGHDRGTARECQRDAMKVFSWRLCQSFQKGGDPPDSPICTSMGKVGTSSSAPLALHCLNNFTLKSIWPPRKISLQAFPWWRLTRAAPLPSFYRWEDFEAWGSRYIPAVTLRVGSGCGSQSKACQLSALLLVLRMIHSVCVSNASGLCFWIRQAALKTASL